MKIKIKDLLEYFDLKETTSNGDATAIISIVGEDLNAAIFKHYCESDRGSKVDIIEVKKPTTMRRKGKWLDRWILESRKGEDILYQTEIKNWCSRAIGGVNVPLDINDKDLEELAEKKWLQLVPWIESNEQNGTNKVIDNMTNDIQLKLSQNYKKEPLLILWEVRKPKNEKGFFFKYKLSNKHFYYDYFWFFSCSFL